MSTRLVTIPPQGKREKIEFSREFHPFSNIHEAIRAAGSESALLELVYQNDDRKAIEDYLQRREVMLEVVPKLANQLRVYVQQFTAMSNISASDAMAKGVEFFTKSELAPPTYAQLSPEQIAEAVQGALAERKKPGRKAKQDESNDSN